MRDVCDMTEVKCNHITRDWLSTVPSAVVTVSCPLHQPTNKGNHTMSTKTNWFVDAMNYLISLFSTGKPRIDAFLGMMSKICVIIIVLGLLLSLAMGTVQDIFPSLIEPIQNLIGSGAEAVGDALKPSDSGAINQLPAGIPADPDVPYVVNQG